MPWSACSEALVLECMKHVLESFPNSCRMVLMFILVRNALQTLLSFFFPNDVPSHISCLAKPMRNELSLLLKKLTPGKSNIVHIGKMNFSLVMLPFSPAPSIYEKCSTICSWQLNQPIWNIWFVKLDHESPGIPVKITQNISVATTPWLVSSTMVWIRGQDTEMCSPSICISPLIRSGNLIVVEF